MHVYQLVSCPSEIVRRPLKQLRSPHDQPFSMRESGSAVVSVTMLLYHQSPKSAADLAQLSSASISAMAEKLSEHVIVRILTCSAGRARRCDVLPFSCLSVIVSGVRDAATGHKAKRRAVDESDDRVKACAKSACLRHSQPTLKCQSRNADFGVWKSMVIELCVRLDSCSKLALKRLMWPQSEPQTLLCI